jgi:hypothetical protein
MVTALYEGETDIPLPAQLSIGQPIDIRDFSRLLEIPFYISNNHDGTMSVKLSMTWVAPEGRPLPKGDKLATYGTYAEGKGSDFEQALEVLVKLLAGRTALYREMPAVWVIPVPVELTVIPGKRPFLVTGYGDGVHLVGATKP